MGRSGSEAVAQAVIAGHAEYDGDFELRIGPGTGPDTEGDPLGRH
ncbi:hypothetical protein [Streptomyces sp. A3M-1-3]|nr:hypothetical protein [Streptomyces sp. A3M-1-3]